MAFFYEPHLSNLHTPLSHWGTYAIATGAVLHVVSSVGARTRPRQLTIIAGEPNERASDRVSQLRAAVNSTADRRHAEQIGYEPERRERVSHHS